MIVAGVKLISLFLQRHPDARSPCQAWLSEVKAAKWSTPSDIKERYVHASFLHDDQVIFNIGGNKYRILTCIDYDRSVLKVMRVGTHAEYNTWRL